MNEQFGPAFDPDIDTLRSADASTAELRRIASTRPDLLAGIAGHPNTDPELLQWLSTSIDPAIQNALARRGGRRGSQSHKRRGWLLGIGGGLTLVLVAVGSFFAFHHFSGPDYESAPGQSAALDLADVGRSTQLARLPQGPEATDTDTELLRLVGARQSVILGLHSTTLSPEWMAPVPHEDLEQSTPETSDEEAPFGEGEPASESALDDTARSTVELAGRPVDCQRMTDTLVCGDRTINLGDGGVSIGSDEGSDAADQAETSDRESPVEDPATNAVPVEVNEDGELIGTSGSAYPDITFGTEDAVSMIGTGENGPWVISNGRTLIGVDSDSVLWETEMSEQAATANGLGEARLQPNWAVADGVFIIADDSGVHGLAAESGEELWRVDAELDSFTVAGTRLLIKAGGVLEVFDFSDSSGKDKVTADPAMTGSGPGGPAPAFPGRGQVLNATLSAPPACAEFGLAYEDYFLGDSPKKPEGTHEATFKDGRAESAEAGDYAGVQMEDFYTTRMGENAVTAIAFSCNGGGNYIYPSLGIYDQDLNLLDSIELWDQEEGRGDAGDISGDMPKPYFNSVSLMGEYVSVDVGGIGVYGDEGCTACEKSATAEVLYRFDGQTYAHQDTTFQLPQGEVRLPALDDVQQFAEAVAAGDDSSAALQATAEVMESLDDVLGDGQTANPPTVRSAQFPKGVKVDTCELIQPYASDSYGSEYYFRNGRTTPGIFSDESIDKGDIVCGVLTPDIDDADQYYLYLLLRGTADGSVEVYEAGRQFS